jgi:hypothetical protein
MLQLLYFADVTQTIFGTLLAFICIASPVCGLRPSLAARVATSKDSKPAKETFLLDFHRFGNRLDESMECFLGISLCESGSSQQF